MQAIIMAAGVGSRLGDLTDGLPKAYLQLAGETLLARNLRLLRDVGVNDIVIVVGHDRERFKRDFAAPDTLFAVNPFYHVANVLSSFWAGMPHLRETFLYLHADTVFDPAVLAGLTRAHGPAVLACDRKTCGEEEMKYKVGDGTVTAINKSMPPPEAHGEFLGLCKIERDVLPALRHATENILADGGLNAFFEVALQRVIDGGSIPVTVHDTGDLPWVEIDFPDDYATAKKLFDHGHPNTRPSDGHP